jgi:biopolymer transport protein ExbD
MNFRKNLQNRNPGFQMAPMIDVVFLLLVFFMVASIYSEWETKVGVDIPTAQSGVTAPRGPGEIIINVDAENQYFVNGVDHSSAQLEELLRSLGEGFPGTPVIIRADKQARYDAVLHVLDLCKVHGFRHVFFATLHDESGGSGTTP